MVLAKGYFVGAKLHDSLGWEEDLGHYPVEVPAEHSSTFGETRWQKSDVSLAVRIEWSKNFINVSLAVVM